MIDHQINPTEALLLCAGLSKGAAAERKTCHVCLERRSYSDSGANDVVIIAATDGTVVFRYDFDLASFPDDHWLQSVTGGLQAPGRAFPNRGTASWGVSLEGTALRLVAHSRSGTPRRKQPGPVEFTQGVGPLLSAWRTLTGQRDTVGVDLPGSSLADCIADLDGCAVAGIHSENGLLVLTAGPTIHKQPWRAELTTPAPEFVPRFVGVEPLWRAIDVHKASTLALSRDDECAPLLFTSDNHVAVVMPLGQGS